MGAIAYQITSLAIVYSAFYSDTDKKNIKARRHWPLCGESPGPVNSPHIWPVSRNMFPFDDVIMYDRITKINAVLRTPHGFLVLFYSIHEHSMPKIF